MSISGLRRAVGGPVAILCVAAGCFRQEPTGCEAWELALEARESAVRAVAVLEYEAEQLEDWISADSTAEALTEVAWQLVPRADSGAEGAWREALAALEAVDETTAESYAIADSVASRYPDGLSTMALQAVQEVATAAAAAFEAVAAGCPRGPRRAAPPDQEASAESVLDGCVARAWVRAAETESALAGEALWRAYELSDLADSALLAAQDFALVGAWEAAVDLRGSTFGAVIEAGIATRRAGDLLDELARYGCPVN